MIGQENLFVQLEQTTLDTFPNSLILLGEKGCGKHLFVDSISKHLNLDVIDITEKLTQEMIDEIYLKVEPHIYIISSEKLNVKNQNSILKFLEEPLKNAYIILLVENKNILLSTVINRCQIWQFEKYATEQLKTFKTLQDDSIIFQFATTPADIIKSEEPRNPVAEICALCDKLIDKIPVASFSNILSITNKIAFKEGEEKYDLTLFLKALNYAALQKLINSENVYYQKVYKNIDKLCNDMQIANINKKVLFENFLVKMKELSC